MTNDELFDQQPLFLHIGEGGQAVPVVPLGADFYYSMDFLREHAAENMQHGSAENPLWQAGFVNDNAQALRVYYQIPNVPDDVSAWGQTLYKVGTYFVYKVFDENGKVVYRKLEHDVPISAVFLIALSIATAGAAAALGAAVIGAEAAAAYPALAQAIGSAMINTVVNGGDVEKSVKGAALSYVAGAAGNFVGSNVAALTDADLLGKVAGNVTTSVVKGGNILVGAASPLISEGANYAVGYASDLFNSQPATPSFSTPGGSMDEFDFGSDASYGFDDPMSGTDWFSDGEQPVFTFGGFDDSTASNFHDPVYDGDVGTVDFGNGDQSWDTPVFTNPDDIQLPDPSIFLPDFQVQGGADVPTTAGGTDWGATIAKLGTIALQVYNQQHNPNIKAVNTSVRLPDGSVQTVNRNGTVTTRAPNGQTTTTQLPPGQPYRFPDGTVVMNNGNGSYTRQGANGQIATQQYGGAGGLFSGGVSAPLLLGGAALLLFALRK